ncbi:AAA family ATPase, partial [bacterium]|nr:AAA family ATPase [bacterium]
MLFQEIYIDGFGIFHNKDFKDLSPNLNLFCGNNETGKSTLLAFIRYQFFNLPREKKDRYEPLAGGNHGGRIILYDKSNERFTLWDFMRKKKNDNRYDDRERLFSRINMVTQDIYEFRFAFDLKELSEFKVFANESFLGSQIGLNPRRLYEFENELIEQIKKINSGEKDKDKGIKKIISNVQDTRKEINDISLKMEGYSGKKLELEAIQKNISAMVDKKRENENEKTKYEKFDIMFSDWNDYCRKTKELSEPELP